MAPQQARQRVPEGRGGSEARRAMRRRVKVEPPFITRKIPTYELLSEEGLQLIEETAETILQEVGIEFRGDQEALDLWKSAGADIAGERVRLPRGLARELVKTAPGEFIQYARNPARNVQIGGDAIVLAPGYGSPFVTDLDKGRRYATLEDFQNIVKLAYIAPYLHHSGGTVCEPVDVAVNKRHLDMVYSLIRYSDKPFMGSVTAAERAQDTVEMAKILFGTDFISTHPVLLSLINVNSPMVLDSTMLGALKVYASNNQATIITPFILQGAMSPSTSGGTLAQLLAEALAGIAFTQLIRPGAPVVFGSFACTISMRSGAPTLGTPESALALFGAAQLARRLGLPFRSGGGVSSSKIPDAQTGVETGNGLSATLLAGVNFVLHAAGLLEGGLSTSLEKFIIDVDQCGMLQAAAAGIDLSENSMALDAIREVGPGSHYLGCAHTLQNFETAMHESFIADSNRYEQWIAEGSLSIAQRANTIWKKWLSEYELPLLDPGIDEELEEFVEKRKKSMPDSVV